MAKPRKAILKIAVDAGMVAIMPALMAYSLLGEHVHGRIGAIAGVLFVVHLWLNRAWIAVAFRGRYNLLRIAQTVLAVAVLLAILVTMLCGIGVARSQVGGLPLWIDASLVEVAHITAAHWAFVFMSLHCGLNWPRIARAFSATAAGRKPGRTPGRKPGKIGLFVVVTVVSAYGVVAFFTRETWRYLLGLNHYAFVDFMEPAWHCMLEYLAIMIAFAVLGAITGRLLSGRTSSTAS